MTHDVYTLEAKGRLASRSAVGPMVGHDEAMQSIVEEVPVAPRAHAA